MINLKKIVFRHEYGPTSKDVFEEVMELDKDTTEEEINEIYVAWVFEQIGDKFTWYEEK